MRDYIECKKYAEKISNCLQNGAVVLDENGAVVSPDARFVFDDKREFIAIREDNVSVVYCGTEPDGSTWGDPDIKVFKQFRVCVEFIDLEAA